MDSKPKDRREKLKILMTGITGLVGAAFVTSLLKQHPDYKIVSLCRGFGNESGKDRAEKTIRIQCEFDGIPEASPKKKCLRKVPMTHSSIVQLM